MTKGVAVPDRRLKGAVIALGAAALSLSLAAPSGAATAAVGSPVGITATTINVGQVDTLTGPVPGLFKGAEDGTQAYLDYINSKGGVNGRKIHLDVGDDKFSGANYTTATQQLVNEDFALVGGFSLFDDSGVPAINAAKIPDVTMSLSSARETDQYNYAPVPLVPGSAALGPYKYYKKAYGDAYKHVGTLYSNQGSAESQTLTAFSAMESIGYHVDYQRVVGVFDSDFTADVLKMKSAGVQMVIIVGMAVTQVADLAKDMAAQGFKPKLFASSGTSYDANFIPLAGSAANGHEVGVFTALYQGQDAKVVPAVALFDKWMKKVDPKFPIDGYAVYGWTSAELFVQALQAAGASPTRASLLAQLNKITSFDGGGLLAPGNPAQKIPESCWFLAKVQNGQWVRTSPSPKSGFLCSPGGYYYPKGTKKFVRSN
jgi:branched-chain amino acid transport system substrate-binding protein